MLVFISKDFALYYLEVATWLTCHSVCSGLLMVNILYDKFDNIHDIMYTTL